MMNNYRFISRSVYRMRSIIREGNRDAMPKRDMRSHCGLLLIYQAMYVLSRVIRTYTFRFLALRCANEGVRINKL